MNVCNYFFVLFYGAAETCLAEKSNPPTRIRRNSFATHEQEVVAIIVL
jgi:hypothetical protein